MQGTSQNTPEEKDKKEQRPLPPIDQNQRYTIPEAAEYLRCSQAYVYQKIASGKVQTLKDGRRTYIHGSELIRVSGAADVAA